MEGEVYVLMEEGAKHVFPLNFFYVQVYFYHQFCSFTKKTKTKKTPPHRLTAKVITHAHADSQELSQRSAWSGWLFAAAVS